MMRNQRRRILELWREVGLARWLGLTAVLVYCVACATNPKKPGVLKGALATTPPQSTPGMLVSTGFRGAVQPLGSIAYDGFTLPVVAPDGRHFAVQSTDGATVKSRLAVANAPIPPSRITQYRIEEHGLSRLVESDAGLLLGRGASFAGCLCEGPRNGGARAIGVMPWGRLEVEWLVDDGRVNAFASLGSDGTLAWSSRDVVGGAWSLTIRIDGASDDAVIAPPEGASWVFPVAVSRHCVCALLLRDGVASFAKFDPSNATTLQDAPTLTRISDRMDLQLASQMFAPQQGLDAVTPTGELLYFDPTRRAITAWNPQGGKCSAFSGQPMALCFVDRMRVAVLSGTEVRLRSLSDEQEPGTRLMDTIAVPRRLPSPDGRQGILFVAPHEQTLRLAILRPSPAP